MEPTLEWLAKYKAVLEADYPYVGTKASSCNWDGETKYQANTEAGYIGTNFGDLKVALLNGPASVGIEADKLVFQLY